MDKYTGETTANYFLYFKQVIKAGTKDSYWRYNPAEDVSSRKNPVAKLKENLEADEYIKGYLREKEKNSRGKGTRTGI